jgi:hypothetical protein
MANSTTGSFNMFFPAQVAVITTPRKWVLFTLIRQFLLEFLIHFPACIALSEGECSVFWLGL